MPTTTNPPLKPFNFPVEDKHYALAKKFKKRVRKVIKFMRAAPEDNFTMTTWGKWQRNDLDSPACGTTCCFAGFAANVSYHDKNFNTDSLYDLSCSSLTIAYLTGVDEDAGPPPELIELIGAIDDFFVGRGPIWEQALDLGLVENNKLTQHSRSHRQLNLYTITRKNVFDTLEALLDGRINIPA